jgi:hypothetical protein
MSTDQGGGSDAAPVGAGELKLEVVVLTGIFHHAGTGGRQSGPAPEHASYGSFAAFSDPDGNGWLLQEIKKRLPGR